MNEFIRMVSEKTGLSDEMARMAVNVVAGYLKEHVPPPIADQIDRALSGGGMSGEIGDLTKGLGDILGR